MPDIEPFRTVPPHTIDYDTPSSDETPFAAPPIPEAVGDYQILERLGQGGMGAVYRAVQKSTQRIVALKLIRADRLADLSDSERTSWLDRFRAESQAAARLDHEHAVTVFEVGSVGSQLFYSMKFVAGESLADRIRKKPIDPNLAAEWIEQIARAVHHAHERGILHRDLKPANILIDSTGKAMVTDFGIAKLDSGSQTHTGQVLGTPQFMAPEQAMDSAHIAPTSDVYGLGATLYAALTGRPPFQASTLAETIRQVMEVDCAPPRQLNPAIPKDLETICLKCLHKEPARRYATARLLAEDLARFRAGEPIQARRVSGFERAWKWTRRHPVAAGLLVTMLLGGSSAIVASMQWTRARRAEADAALRRTIKFADDAMLAAQRGQWAEALTQLDKAIDEGHPDGPGLRLFRIRVLEAGGDRKAARAMARQLSAMTMPPEHLGFSKVLQAQYLLGFDDDQAIALLHQALQLELPPAEREFAQTMLAMSIPEALDHAAKTIAIQPWHYGAIVEAFRWSAALGRLEEAREYSRRAAILFPHDFQMRSLSVFVEFFAHGDLAKAQKELKSYRGRMPDADLALGEVVLEFLDHCMDVRRLQVSGGFPMMRVLKLISTATSHPSFGKETKTESHFADQIQFSPHIRRRFLELIPSTGIVSLLTKEPDFDKFQSMYEVWPTGFVRFLLLSKTISDASQTAFTLEELRQRIRDLSREAIAIAEMPSLFDVRRPALDEAIAQASRLVFEHQLSERPNDYALAVDLIRRRLAIGPIDKFDRPVPVARAAIILARAGEVAQARSLADTLDRLHPGKDSARAVLKAQIETSAGQHAAALETAKAGLQKWPDGPLLGQIAEEAASNLEAGSPKDHTASPEYMLASRAIHSGGAATVLTTIGTRRTVTKIEAIPKIGFQITGTRIAESPFDEEVQSLLRKINTLQSVELRNCLVNDQQLACLSANTQLTNLIIEQAPLTDAGLQVLSNMSRLSSLVVRQTAITGTGLTHLAPNALRELIIDGAATDQGLAELTRFPKLESLEIRGTNLSDKLAATVRKCRLSSLAITGPITDLAFENYGRTETLRRLALRETQISDRGLDLIADQFPNLTQLEFVRSGITDSGLMVLASKLPDLETLGLAQIPVTDAGLVAVSNMKRLKWLNLSSTAASNSGLKVLTQLPRLEFLDLTGTRINDDGLESLERMQRLTRLRLRNTGVSKDAIARLQTKLPKCIVEWDQPSTN